MPGVPGPVGPPGEIGPPGKDGVIIGPRYAQQLNYITADTIKGPGDALPLDAFLVPAGHHEVLVTVDFDVPEVSRTFVSVELRIGKIPVWTETRSVPKAGQYTLSFQHNFSNTEPEIVSLGLGQFSDPIRLRSGNGVPYSPVTLKLKTYTKQQ